MMEETAKLINYRHVMMLNVVAHLVKLGIDSTIAYTGVVARCEFPAKKHLNCGQFG